ncbi:hypothetical protein RC74_20505 [Falsihalocynthiibacter arcticus]|uniref:Uncharacterized protein n=1 Tax=Falsihalocynthiibacter arcticus TaxID=1579316 RepID=A0A126V4W7_9RHOB|nr:hypothetical protein RC74_20505 [Falsihalocynthiibacter arcticus]
MKPDVGQDYARILPSKAILMTYWGSNLPLAAKDAAKESGETMANRFKLPSIVLGSILGTLAEQNLRLHS